MDALADLIRTLEDAAERRPDDVEYLVRRAIMPAGVLLYDRDRAGRLFAYVPEEFLSKLPMAPFTGSSLTAVAGIPVYDAPRDV